MKNLIQHSINVILNGQSESGAYIACPNMPDYAYCWFRDGTFISYAMDRVRQSDSAHRFFDWCASVIIERAEIIEHTLDKVANGEPLEPSDLLHTRYTLDGKEGQDDWPNFQLDGFGTWLWGMVEHLRDNRRQIGSDWLEAAHLTARYLSALWQRPNYDCWEEFGNKIHPHTLAAIYGGLNAFGEFSGQTEYSQVAEDIRAYTYQSAVTDGYFVKYLGSDLVDASLLGLAVPYGLVSLDDPVMQATLLKIEADLHVDGGGIWRYAEDTYYGGGEWLLLTAWLGWFYTRSGRFSEANDLLTWVVAQATTDGDMPEQIHANLIAPEFLKRWIDMRGPIATPLLWSHAMYLILQAEIEYPQK